MKRLLTVLGVTAAAAVAAAACLLAGVLWALGRLDELDLELDVDAEGQR